MDRPEAIETERLPSIRYPVVAPMAAPVLRSSARGAEPAKRRLGRAGTGGLMTDGAGGAPQGWGSRRMPHHRNPLPGTVPSQATA